jgi:hypothetical protein
MTKIRKVVSPNIRIDASFGIDLGRYQRLERAQLLLIEVGYGSIKIPDPPEHQPAHRHHWNLRERRGQISRDEIIDHLGGQFAACTVSITG